MSRPPNQAQRPRASVAKLLSFVAILTGGLAIFGSYAKYEAEVSWQRTSEAVNAELGERAARLQELLLRIDRTLVWFRPEDIGTADRLALTGRMLQTERSVTPARSLFLFTPAGRLVAGTLPLPDGSATVSTKHWFKSIEGRPLQRGLQVSRCAADPFGSDEGVVIYRTVFDREVVAGYVGSFLPQAAIRVLARDDEPSNGTIGLALQSADGDTLGCDADVAARPANAGSVHDWLPRVIHGLPTIAARGAVREERTIQPGGLHLIATADALDAMSNDEWTFVVYRASYVGISLILIMVLMSGMMHRYFRLAPPGLPLKAAKSAANAGDWMWELDDSGHLVGLAGNVPDHLLPPSGRSLAEIAGPIGDDDMRWARLTAAICARQAFEGLQVPFHIPGRAGLLTIFAFSGQPVVASGGFWGTASLVSEESVASRPMGATRTKSRLSVA